MTKCFRTAIAQDALRCRPVEWIVLGAAAVGSLPVPIADRRSLFGKSENPDQSLVDLGRAEARARGLENITDADVAEWAEGMQDMLDCFEVGDIVVYHDGTYWMIYSKQIEFDGYFERHKLDSLHHRDALTDPPLLRSVLDDKNYWFEREFPVRCANQVHKFHSPLHHLTVRLNHRLRPNRVGEQV